MTRYGSYRAVTRQISLALRALALRAQAVVALMVTSAVLVPAMPTAPANAVTAHSAQYVTDMFATFLDRTPTSSELAQATESSMTTQTSRYRLVGNIAESGEWIRRTVRLEYLNVLRRSADSGGLAYWSMSLAENNLSLAALRRSLYGSSEYARSLTSEQWVNKLYGDLLGRTPSESDVSYWSSVRALLGRTHVMAAFLGSTEYQRGQVQADYQTILHRPPDSAGLAYWTHRWSELGGIELRLRLAASPEAYGPLQPGEPVVAPLPRPLPDELAHNGLTSKLLTVRSTTWATTTAEFTGWERSVVGWKKVLGTWTARTGYRGWQTRTARRDGNGSSPTGRYGFLGGFGLAENPGYTLGWFVVGPHDYWTSDPSRSDYNTHQYGPSNPATAPWTSAEHLIDYPIAYRYAAVIDFNSPPNGPYGSAIFLHVSTNGPTAGCISLPESQLVRVLRWIDGNTQIVMGPDSVIRRY